MLACSIIQLSIKLEIMKKIIEEKGSDNGPSSSRKKTAAADLPAKGHLSKDKPTTAGHTTSKRRTFNEDGNPTGKTTLKWGSRRNLL